MITLFLQLEPCLYLLLDIQFTTSIVRLSFYPLPFTPHSPHLNIACRVPLVSPFIGILSQPQISFFEQWPYN